MAELSLESEELNKIYSEVQEFTAVVTDNLDKAKELSNEIKDNLEDSSQLRPNLERIVETINKLQQSIKNNLEKTDEFLKEQLIQYEIDTDEAVKKIDKAIEHIEAFIGNIDISNA